MKNTIYEIMVSDAFMCLKLLYQCLFKVLGKSIFCKTETKIFPKICKLKLKKNNNVFTSQHGRVVGGDNQECCPSLCDSRVSIWSITYKPKKGKTFNVFQKLFT